MKERVKEEEIRMKERVRDEDMKNERKSEGRGNEE